MIAALYVETDGVYYGLPNIDPWDERRDARAYAGPWPVVAHPPCNRWVSYGPSWLRGQDEGCFASALMAVVKYGGVLEHPAKSQAWKTFGLPHPTGPHWVRGISDSGWSCEIDQHLYGFPTRKLTWLYYVGEEPPVMPALHVDAGRGCETLWSSQRSKTPPAFRDALIAMAESAARKAGRTLAEDLNSPGGCRVKSIRSNPTVHAAEGDERIRTAARALGTDSAYDGLSVPQATALRALRKYREGISEGTMWYEGLNRPRATLDSLVRRGLAVRLEYLDEEHGYLYEATDA